MIGVMLALTLGLMPGARATSPSGEPYLKTCAGFLEAAREDHVEAFFLNQVTNERQLAQLMVDYRVVFSAEFEAAVLLAAHRRSFRSNSMYRHARALGETRALVGKILYRRERKFIGEVLSLLRQTAARATDEDVARVTHKRTTAFLDAVQASAHRATFERLVGLAIRAVLLSAANKRSVYERTRPSVWTARLGGAFYGFWVAGIGVAYFVGRGDSPMVGMAPIFGAVGAGWLSARLETSYFEKLYGQISSPGPLAPDTPALVSLNAARGVDLKTLSPVDLAYLGHLELRALGTSSLARVSGQNLGALIEALRTHAGALSEGGRSARAQIQFAAAINDLKNFIGALPKSDARETRAVEQKASDVAADIAAIERKVYAHGSEHLNDETMLKLEIVAAKLESDLIRASQVRVDRERMRRVTEVLEPVAARLEAIFTPVPRDDEQWKAAADDALVALDELTLGLTR